jgi:NADP-dependent 3-hydroxy acid dehydrogenase YdfG
MPVIAIAGNGPRLRYAIAEVFGMQGYKVALLSHDGAELSEPAVLAKQGIEGAGFGFNVHDRRSVTAALAAVTEQLGPVDVLEFSAAEAVLPLATGLALDKAQVWIDHFLQCAAAAVDAVLPEMLRRRSGTILFTAGVSSAYPELDGAAFSNFGLISDDLRDRARSMHNEFASRGVQVGCVVIGAYLGQNPHATPEAIAPLYWELHTHRDEVERIFKPETMTRDAERPTDPHSGSQ